MKRVTENYRYRANDAVALISNYSPSYYVVFAAAVKCCIGCEKLQRKQDMMAILLLRLSFFFSKAFFKSLCSAAGLFQLIPRHLILPRRWAIDPPHHRM